MRRLVLLALLAACLLPAACVTINVYFPEAAAERAAGQFVDKVLGESPAPASQPQSKDQPPGHSPAAMLLDFLIPSAQAQQANINVQTPQVKAIQARMQQRFTSVLSACFDSGAIGFTRDGLVAVRDAAAIALPERARVNAAVADENRDREAVYREIAIANGHPEWEAQIRAAFAKQWIEHARAGWYYQSPTGTWTRK